MSTLPKTSRQIMAIARGTNFREVTEVQEVPIPELGPKTMLVKMKYVGINAADINFIGGRYFNDVDPPFPCGFEGIGEVVAVGPECKFKVGQFVAAWFVNGAFGEYVKVDETLAAVMPSTDPEYLAMVLSGPTASISLEKEGNLKQGETVLVTAAAGGTGVFAVQLAKLAGCHVIGTCSNDEKVEFLKSLGCDRPINYKTEDLDAVLKKEYPKGVDVVYECIGKEMFDIELKNLATFGRLIVIGQITKYVNKEIGQETLTEPESKYPIALGMLHKSSRIAGFFLPHYTAELHDHIADLIKLYSDGKLKVAVDNGEKSPTGPFKGLEKVADALDYMYASKNIGKVVVEV